VLDAFNIAGIRACIEEVRSSIDDFKGGEFCLMVNLLHLFGATPEVYKEIYKFKLWVNNQNLIVLTVVLTSPAILSIISLHVASLEHKRTKLFTKESDAVNWLNKQKDIVNN